MGRQRPRIGEDRVELLGPHGLHVRFQADYAVVGKDDDLARHLAEAPADERGALVLERKAEARRDAVRRDERRRRGSCRGARLRSARRGCASLAWYSPAVRITFTPGAPTSARAPQASW